MKNNYSEDKNIQNFKKYGIEILDDGTVYGPDRPLLNGQTPIFNYNKSSKAILDLYKDFLNQNLSQVFSLYENQEIILSIVDKIVKSITGHSYKNYTNIIVMNNDDFDLFKKTINDRLSKERGINNAFQAINLGGLIVISDLGGDNCFPLLFHEIGHTLYPDENNNYIDELRAMYFQIISTKLFEKELNKIGINNTYPDNYYKDITMPSNDHKKAFDDARTLYYFQLYHDLIVKGDNKKEIFLEKLLTQIKQEYINK